MAALALALLASLGCEEKQAAPEQRTREATPATKTHPQAVTPDIPARTRADAFEIDEALYALEAMTDDEWAKASVAVSELEHPKLRVHIFWANEDGWPVYSPTQAYPDGFVGERVDISLKDAHITIKANFLEMRRTSSGGPDINELARVLLDISAREPMPIEIAPRAAVPFRYVIAAVDACARARIGSIHFKGLPELKSVDPRAVLFDDCQSLDARDRLRMALPFSLTVKPEAAGVDRSPRIVVNVLHPGETIVVERQALRPEALESFITGRAKAAGTNVDGRTRLAARIRCDSACTFLPVFRIMRACAKAGITDVTFASRGVTEEHLLRFRESQKTRH
jgi:biopolymer transport protein ExbD